MTNVTIQIPKTGSYDAQANLGRAMAKLRRTVEIEGIPEILKRKRFFLDKRQHKKAKAGAKMRVGGKPQKFLKKW